MSNHFSPIAAQQFRVQAVDVNPVAAEILSFLRLPEGWHYGNGVPARANAVLNALQFSRTMKDLGFGRFEAFPETGGGVLLSSFSDDNIVEILFRADGSFDVTVEQDGSFAELESAENVDKATALGIIWTTANRNQSRLFGSSILGSIAARSVDSKVLPSEIMATVFRSWNLAVPQGQAVVFANTFLTFTQISQVNHQFTGGSLRRIFHEPSRSVEPHQQQGTSATLSPWVVTTKNISTGSVANR